MSSYTNFFRIFLFCSSIFFLTGCFTSVKKILPQPAVDNYRFKLEKEQQLSQSPEQGKKYQKTDYLLMLIDEAVKIPDETKKQNLQTFIQKFIDQMPDNIDYVLNQHSYGFITAKNKLMTLANAIDVYFDRQESHQTATIIVFTSAERYHIEDARYLDKLFQSYQNKLCLLVIDVKKPHADNRLFKPHYCAEAVSLQKLKYQTALSNQIDRLFFYDRLDEDGDGINNIDDQCPGSQKDILITWDGCARDSMKSNPLYIISPQSTHKNK
jgi:hypothetical protein